MTIDGGISNQDQIWLETVEYRFLCAVGVLFAMFLRK